MSPELTILDDLLGGDVSLDQARALFDRDERFTRAILFMLDAGEIRLLDSSSGAEVPRRRWAESLLPAALRAYRLSITDRGLARIS